MASKALSLQIFLLALILFSWGLLFLSVALPGQHAFRKDLKRIHFLEQITLDGHQSRQERLTEVRKRSCSDCWSLLSEFPKANINSSRGWSHADDLYFSTLSSALMSIRLRLRMAQKVAGKKKQNISKIGFQVKKLQEKIQKVLTIRKEYSSLETAKLSSVTSSSPNSPLLDRKLMSNFAEDLIEFKSSKENSLKSSLSHVPSSQISVIVDGRDCDIELLLKSKAELFPQMVFHVAINLTTPLDVDFTSEKNIYIHEITRNLSAGAVYNMLLNHIKTPYTFVASDLLYFHEDIQFRKLISLLKTANVWAVGGSVLASRNEWQNGCLQSNFKNFRLTLYKKNIAWLDDCLLCSFLEGPFLATTPMLKTLEWNEQLSKKAVILDLFLRASHFHHFMVASCPDSVFSLLDHYQHFERDAIVALANAHRLKEIHLPNFQSVILECREMTDVCREPGEIVSPCCLHELSSMIKFFLGTCEAHRLYCELQEGSLLGAVKLGNVLPWEKDADLTFHTANFSALQELSPVFSNAGFTLKLTDNRWCCVNGSEAGGEGKLTSEHWTAELYSQHAMDSEEMTRNRVPPTKVELDRSWVLSPASPGEFVRNRYGKNIYRHAEHWMDLGKLSGWEEYSRTDHFTTCHFQGHHACLDLNPTDGATHFQLPCV